MEKYLVKTKRRLSDEDCCISESTKRVKTEETEHDTGQGNLEDCGDLASDHKTRSQKTALDRTTVRWKEIRAENLNCDYCILYKRTEADRLLRECEEVLTYNSGQLAKVNIFGKWHDIPRQQVAHGDSGLAYKFSNNTVPARPWIPLLERVRDQITQLTGYTFNFVLMNRYKDGQDHMGEHRDDEKDLVHGYPIASLTLGQARDFVFKHGESRGKNATRKIAPIKLELQHGGLLMMKEPTNTYWYHSLPPRKRLQNIRINMTFRKMVTGRKS